MQTLTTLSENMCCCCWVQKWLIILLVLKLILTLTLTLTPTMTLALTLLLLLTSTLTLALALTLTPHTYPIGLWWYHLIEQDSYDAEKRFHEKQVRSVGDYNECSLGLFHFFTVHPSFSSVFPNPDPISNSNPNFNPNLNLTLTLILGLTFVDWVYLLYNSAMEQSS